jgi:hypothetical protein
MASGSAAMLRRAALQASAEHLQQCVEFLPLRNRGLGPLAVTAGRIVFLTLGFLLWAPANAVLVESRRKRLDQTEPITAVSVGHLADAGAIGRGE